MNDTLQRRKNKMQDFSKSNTILALKRDTKYDTTIQTKWPSCGRGERVEN